MYQRDHGNLFLKGDTKYNVKHLILPYDSTYSHHYFHKCRGSTVGSVVDLVLCRVSTQQCYAQAFKPAAVPRPSPEHVMDLMAHCSSWPSCIIGNRCLQWGVAAHNRVYRLWPHCPVNSRRLRLLLSMAQCKTKCSRTTSQWYLSPDDGNGLRRLPFL